MATTTANPEAFLLLTLQNASLEDGSGAESGTLALECVTIAEPENVFLVLRLNAFETPIEPSRIISCSSFGKISRKYTFHPTELDPTQLVLTLALPDPPQPDFLADVDTFDSILSQYANVRGLSDTDPPLSQPKFNDDLRGHVILVNQDEGEVVGELDKKYSVQEDPVLYEKSHENDPVVIEVLEESKPGGETALQFFARAVPADQQDWITKSATVVSHMISQSTNLLLTTVTSASSRYMASAPASSSEPPSRALVFLSSERTRQGLSRAHAFSGQAVKVSSKTINLIDNMIFKALGGKNSSSNKGKTPATRLPTSSSSTLALAPPPYTPSEKDRKPPLPPRRTPSPTPSPSVPKSSTPTSISLPPLPPRMSKKARLILSADLILSTIDESTKKVLEVGTDTLSKIVTHKYGPDVSQSSLHMAGTVKNVALVYVDMKGIGRKAIVRRVAKRYVKSMVML